MSRTSVLVLQISKDGVNVHRTVTNLLIQDKPECQTSGITATVRKAIQKNGCSLTTICELPIDCGVCSKRTTTAVDEIRKEYDFFPISNLLGADKVDRYYANLRDSMPKGKQV